MPKRLPWLIIFVLLFLGACNPGALPIVGNNKCGDPPELPYACAGGVFPCECVDHGDGTAQWHCAECPPVDCTTNPGDALCKQDSSCIGCHGLASSEGGVGIENSHPWAYVGCVACHGGSGRDAQDPTRQLTKEEAHAHIPHEIAQAGSVSVPTRSAYANYYLAKAGVENLEGGKEWLRFVNPGDLRVVDDSCAADACHKGMGETVRRSTMASAVGKLDGLLYAMGVPRATDLAGALGDDSFGKRLATYGSMHVDDPTWDRATSPPGSVPHLHPLTGVDREQDKPYGTFTEQDVQKETVNKLCGTCHLGTSGKNSSFGNFRSSGCSACHMAYDWSGQSQSGDPMVNKQEPTYPAAYQQIQYPERPHPPRHVLRRNPTAQDCLACHTGSARLVLQYMGIRTDDNRDLSKAKARGADIDFRFSDLIDNTLQPAARLHGFAQDQLIEYEDLDKDGQDDTPADVHYLAGLECVDCHNSTEMHGDGKIYSRQNQQVQVRCVSCHGNLEFDADPDATDNPINQLFFKTGKESRKNLFEFAKVPAYGEAGYPTVTAPGIWLRTKAKGEWRFVSQIRWGVQWDPNAQDCIGDGRRTDPRTGGFACRPASSIAHGRWQGYNQAGGDFDDGVGPRPGIEVVRGGDGASSSVRFGFSHLGEKTTRANELPAAGLECIACHGTWNGQRFGNHMGLTDVNGNQRLYDWDRTTGEVTLGTQGWFNFTFVSMLDQQLGVSEKGKISWFTPTRLKIFLRSQVLNPAINQADEFMSQVGDTDFVWKTYRDRVGRGNLIQGSAAGIEDAPGYASICLEPSGYCDQNPQKNQNGGLGVDTMGPHASQLRAKDCTSCHLDENGGGIDAISALYGWNPTGFNAQTSAYLNAIDRVEAPHGTYSTASGFVIADDGIQHQLDYMVDEATGFPYVWTPLVRIDDGKDGRPRRGYDTYDPAAAGPITKNLIDLLKRVRVRDAR